MTCHVLHYWIHYSEYLLPLWNCELLRGLQEDGVHQSAAARGWIMEERRSRGRGTKSTFWKWDIYTEWHQVQKTSINVIKYIRTLIFFQRIKKSEAALRRPGGDWHGVTGVWGVPQHLRARRHWCHRGNAARGGGAALVGVPAELLPGCAVSLFMDTWILRI